MTLLKALSGLIIAVAFLVPSAQAQEALTTVPPRASLISISPADENSVAIVTGAPGAVEGGSTVVVANLQTLQVNITDSEPDGSFSVSIFAPPGSFVQVKHDNTNQYLPNMNFGSGTNDRYEVAPGTILYVPPTASGTGIPFATMSFIDFFSNVQSDTTLSDIRTFGAFDPGQWWVSGTMDSLQWNPGESISLRGNLVINSKNIDGATDLSTLTVDGFLSLEKLFDDQGKQQQRNQQFMSSIMTPTGFPLERFGGELGVGNSWEVDPLQLVGEHRLESNWSHDILLPPDTPPGIYRPVLHLNIQGIPTGIKHLDAFPAPEGGNYAGTAALPLVRVGSPMPPHLFFVLGLNDFSNGSRGTIALEDRGKFQVASHVITNTDAFIVPMKDERTGMLMQYRLEPFVPMISNSTGRLPDSPQIPFKFPSGSLTVKVIKPDGTTDELGSAHFLQSMSRSPLTSGGIPISRSSAHVTDFYQLTTLDPRFEHSFTQYGRHLVVMTGSIEDIWGNVYEGGGTYELFVAKTLDLETGVMAGTPFQVGNVFSPAVIVQPAVPAAVEIKFKLLINSDPNNAVARVINGRANRYGYFNPQLSEPILLSGPGEYRVDITASYVDGEGVLWMGAVTWGNVVETPNSPLITHGRRGFDGVDRIQQQWFFVREARAGGDHVMFPFNRGDIMWMEEFDPAADIPKISIQDTEGSFAQRVRNRPVGNLEAPDLEERIAAGEIPLFSTVSDGRAPAIYPNAVDQWGYFYAFAERPGVHIREFVSEDSSSNGYWRFDENYHFQLGNGINGDLPNDFKFHFGGAVYRDLTDSFFYYGAYGSLFVLVASGDPEGGRVFPPFQGAAGGPSGGPIMTLKGKPIDIFFHPTGTRPGSILETGDIVSFAGQIGPTLPSKVQITVTSPNGDVREISGQANKVGYFYKPSTDFIVDQAGPYRVKVIVWHDGETSAGVVVPPFPTGDVLGSDEGEFSFYVVDPAAADLLLNLPPVSFVRPAEGPVNISISPPSGLSDVQLRFSTVMPGFILEEGTKTELTYNYDAVRLHQDFPNLDLSDADGRTGVDTVTMSFLVSGTDAEGKQVYQARQVRLQDEVLLPQVLQTFTLTVTKAGSGSVTVTSSPAGINCGSDCTKIYAINTAVTLTATPGPGASFKEWGGACSGTSTTCTVTMNTSKSVTATFSKIFTDDPLTAQVTPVKTAHITELREAINTLRSNNGLAAFSFTDSTLTAGVTQIRSFHLTELRTALDEVYDVLGRARPSYTNPTIVAGQTVIKKSRIEEIRAAIRAVEALSTN